MFDFADDLGRASSGTNLHGLNNPQRRRVDARGAAVERVAPVLLRLYFCGRRGRGKKTVVNGCVGPARASVYQVCVRAFFFGVCRGQRAAAPRCMAKLWRSNRKHREKFCTSMGNVIVTLQGGNAPSFALCMMTSPAPWRKYPRLNRTVLGFRERSESYHLIYRPISGREAR